jgi:hydroxymethylglutaryl-CoA reductase
MDRVAEIITRAGDFTSCSHDDWMIRVVIVFDETSRGNARL